MVGNTISRDQNQGIISVFVGTWNMGETSVGQMLKLTVYNYVEQEKFIFM